MGKKRDAVSLSEIARRANISRQSVRNWMAMDNFPSPVVADGTHFSAGRGSKAADYRVVDSSHRTKFFDWQAVKEWADNRQSLKTQHERPTPARKVTTAKPKAAATKAKAADKPARKATASAAAAPVSKAKVTKGKSKKVASKPVTKAKSTKKVVKKGKKAKA